MKKILLFASALAGLFLAGSCQRENLEPAAQGGVTYEISLPTGPQTKGEKGYDTYDLYYEVYKTVDASELAALAQPLFEDKVTMTGNTHTLQLDLLNDQDYTILFWANKKDMDYFDLADLRKVGVKQAASNNDDRDAFCGKDQLVQINGAQSKTVELKRPFAQINIATLVNAVDYDINPRSSLVKVKNIPVKYNVFTGEPVGDAVEVDYTVNLIPDGNLTVNGTDYKKVAMNYALVPATQDNSATVDVYYEINTNNGTVKNTIPNVPVKKNYRTNIIGNLLTSNATYTIEVVPGFEEGDLAPEAIYLAAALGGEFTLTKDLELKAPVVVPENTNFVLNLNGKSIKNTTQSEVFGEGEGIIAYGNLTINGEGAVEGSTMAVWARGNDGAKVTINGGTYKGCAEGFAKGGRSVIYASSGNVIDIYGGTFEALAADKTSYANKTEGVKAALNVADNNGMINVYGGTFVGQNPAAPGTEPAAWNAAHPNGFVADGYSTVLKGSGYVVVRQIVADLFDVAEETKVTFTENLPVSNGTTIHTQGATAEITIEGNGMSVVSTADSAEDFQWEGGKFPSMSTILSSEDGSLVRVNDLTFEGTMSALMLGHYVDSNSNWYNTELNNVNVVNTKVVSFSSNVAPAVCVYGKATMNNCNVYGTTLSELDTDPMWPVYDVAVVNEAVLTLDDSNIGTIIAWAKSRIVVKAGSVVESIKPIHSSMNTNAKYGIVVEAGATVNAIDLTNIDSNKKINITIEDGANVGKIIADGVEYRSLEHYKTATVVDNYPSFAESIKAENSVVYLAEGNYNFGDENKLLRFGKGTKIYGDNTRIFLDWGSLLIAEQTTLEDVTIEGVNFGNNSIMKMAYAKGELYFKDCTFSHIRGNQSIHFDGQAGAKVVFENCTFYGRNMYASALDKVIFINCKFLESTWNTEQGNKGVATGWSGINMWGKYEFNQCQFDKACTCNVKQNGVEADFIGCTYTDGSDITGVIKNSQNYSATINFN